MYGLVWIFLAIVVNSVTGIVDTSGTDRYSTTNLLSSECKVAMCNLKTYLEGLENQIKTFIQSLKGGNSVVAALNGYRASYQSPRRSERVQESVDTSEAGEEHIKSLVDKCDDELPFDGLLNFHSKIELAKGKVKAIDYQLKILSHDYTELTDLYLEASIRLIEELNSIMSSEEKKFLPDASDSLYSSITNTSKMCFNRNPKDIYDEVTKKIKHITDCLNTSP